MLVCCQVAVFAAVTRQEPNVNKPESLPKAKSLSRKSKKRKKKKTTSGSIPFVAIPFTTTLQSSTAQVAPQQSAPAPVTTRSVTHVARTPGVHITPVAINQGLPSFSGSNGSAITIDAVNPDDPEPAPAVPYSSDIEVFGVVGTVTSVSVTISGLTHDSPDDLDMLLVAPNGRTFHFWSDVGGTSPTAETTVTIADTGNTVLPDDGPLVSGTTYRPFNNDTTGDTFPVPAPGPPYGEPILAGADTFASVYAGMPDANGTWSLFVTDDTNGNGGTISGGWTLNVTTQVPATFAGQMIISEFRTSGPGGPADEYVELYNTTENALTVQSSDSSAGLGVFSSDGQLRCTVENGTVIPARGHFLCVNQEEGSSVKSTTRKFHPNGLVSPDIPFNAGIALFNTTSGGANLTIQNRLDAVGPTTEPNTLYKEGNGYQPVVLGNLDYAFYRDLRPSGIPKDTGNNEADLIYVDTSAGSDGDGQRLGAPSPEGLADPRTANDLLFASLVAPCTAATSAPNRVRDLTSDPENNSTFGTLSLRRAFTNNSSGAVTRLRFKVIDVTTFPAPSGVSDLRIRTSSSSSENDPCNEKGTLNIVGLTLEQPPSQPNGGGFNSNVSADTINLKSPLPPGETIFVNFLFGVQQTGGFKIYVNIEALP
jgi:hypothetical protein